MCKVDVNSRTPLTCKQENYCYHRNELKPTECTRDGKALKMPPPPPPPPGQFGNAIDIANCKDNTKWAKKEMRKKGKERQVQEKEGG